jgi:hypothetical protein
MLGRSLAATLVIEALVGNDGRTPARGLPALGGCRPEPIGWRELSDAVDAHGLRRLLKGRPNETSICRGRIAIGSAAAAYVLVVRPWQLRWGATDEEWDATLVGDDLIANPDLITTRAITVGTPADQVWPWIAQFGQGGAGRLLHLRRARELVGADIHSTDWIVPRMGRHQGRRPSQAPPGGWAGRNRCGAGPSARPARWRVDGRSAAPVRLHLGLCPAGAAERDDTAAGARAIRINPSGGLGSSSSPLR